MSWKVNLFSNKIETNDYKSGQTFLQIIKAILNNHWYWYWSLIMWPVQMWGCKAVWWGCNGNFDEIVSGPWIYSWWDCISWTGHIAPTKKIGPMEKCMMHSCFYVPEAYILHFTDSCYFSQRTCFTGRLFPSSVIIFINRTGRKTSAVIFLNRTARKITTHYRVSFF